MAGAPTTEAESFNAYKDSYREAVEASIAFSGRNVDYFAEHKALHLLALTRRHVGDPAGVRALDVGCGIGATDARLAGRMGDLHGVDIATEAVERAAQANPGVSYTSYAGDRLPFDDGAFDLAFTINVLHHVPPDRREGFAAEMARVIRPGGLGVAIEHNIFNPLTQFAVSRCEFDEDAILLKRRRTSRLLAAAGLRPAERRYIFFLPARPSVSVAVDRWLSWLPVGGQYYVAATK